MPNSDSIDDIRCDLTTWKRELEKLQNDDEPDEDAIEKCQKHIRTLQDALNKL